MHTGKWVCRFLLRFFIVGHGVALQELSLGLGFGGGVLTFRATLQIPIAVGNCCVVLGVKLRVSLTIWTPLPASCSMEGIFQCLSFSPSSRLGLGWGQEGSLLSWSSLSLRHVLSVCLPLSPVVADFWLVSVQYLGPWMFSGPSRRL